MRELDILILDIESQQRALDDLILATPTSLARNALTEANIHLMVAIHVLKGNRNERSNIRDSVDTTTDNINALPAIRQEQDDIQN